MIDKSNSANVKMNLPKGAAALSKSEQRILFQLLKRCCGDVSSGAPSTWPTSYWVIATHQDNGATPFESTFLDDDSNTRMDDWKSLGGRAELFFEAAGGDDWDFQRLVSADGRQWLGAVYPSKSGTCGFSYAPLESTSIESFTRLLKKNGARFPSGAVPSRVVRRYWFWQPTIVCLTDKKSLEQATA
jgi:hypothetical protein